MTAEPLDQPGRFWLPSMRGTYENVQPLVIVQSAVMLPVCRVSCSSGGSATSDGSVHGRRDGDEGRTKL